MAKPISVSEALKMTSKISNHLTLGGLWEHDVPLNWKSNIKITPATTEEQYIEQKSDMTSVEAKKNSFANIAIVTDYLYKLWGGILEANKQNNITELMIQKKINLYHRTTIQRWYRDHSTMCTVQDNNLTFDELKSQLNDTTSSVTTRKELVSIDTVNEAKAILAELNRIDKEIDNIIASRNHGTMIEVDDVIIDFCNSI